MATTAEKSANVVSFWQKEITSAEKRQERFEAEARKATKIYEQQDETNKEFNILYSNTETLLPNLYNATPRPAVGRRFKDPDPVARLAGMALERVLEYHIDTPDPEYTPFDSLMEMAVLGACVPGLGLTRVKYDVEFAGPDRAASEVAKLKAIETKGQLDKSGDATVALQARDALANQLDPADEIKYETACGEDVPWDRVLFGPGRVWSKLPWIAFRHDMTRADVADSFKQNGEPNTALAEKLKYVDKEGNAVEGFEEEKHEQTPCTIIVWEIWSRSTKEVFFVAPTYKEGPLARFADPLNLQGFFPCPEPCVLFSRVTGFLPRPLYQFYEKQAEELNRLSLRIVKIIEALKVRGFYAGGLKGLDELLKKPDNTLLPAGTQGMDPDGPQPANSIWLMPLEKLIQVLQQLYVQREQCKRVIYEVTGLSDIIRGSTVASETATAQGLKSQWGTLRLKKMQKRVQRYVRDYLRIIAEVASKRFSPETLKAITGIPLPLAEEKARAQAQLQQMQTAPQMPGQTLQEPPKELVEMTKLPSWEEVVSLLQQDLLRNYKIDVETNSTVEPDAIEDQKQVADLMGALGQMFQAIMPAVTQAGLPMSAFKAMLLGVSRRYRFGEDVEDILQQIPDQLPQQQDQGKATETQAKIQLTQAETQGKIKVMGMEVQVKEKELALKERELALKEQELAIKERELSSKAEASAIKSQSMVESAQAKAAAARVAAAASVAAPRPAPQGANPGQVPPGASPNAML